MRKIIFAKKAIHKDWYPGESEFSQMFLNKEKNGGLGLNHCSLQVHVRENERLVKRILDAIYPSLILRILYIFFSMA